MYSWDQASVEDHVADWIANGDYCLTTDFTGGTSVTGVWQSQDIGIENNAPLPFYITMQDSANNIAPDCFV
jgi:hypothetical protein